MTTPLDRSPWRRIAASVVLLLHLSLVGFVPAVEGLHQHEHVPGAEWHTDGPHEHGHEGDTCLLLLVGTSAGLTTEGAQATQVRPCEQVLVEAKPESPRVAALPELVTARGPPTD